MTDHAQDTRIKLEKKLRKLWDNDDYVLGIICFAKTVENWEKISQFIDMAYRMGDKITADDISSLATILAENNGKEKNKGELTNNGER